MKKVLLMALISSGISFLYYYYNKKDDKKDDIKKVDIRWDDEIIYIDELDEYSGYYGQLILYEDPVPIYKLYQRNERQLFSFLSFR